MTAQEVWTFVGVVTALLFADVIVRAVIWGYDAAEIGGGDIAFAIAATVVLMTRTDLLRTDRK